MNSNDLAILTMSKSSSSRTSDSSKRKKTTPQHASGTNGHTNESFDATLADTESNQQQTNTAVAVAAAGFSASPSWTTDQQRFDNDSTTSAQTTETEKGANVSVVLPSQEELSTVVSEYAQITSNNTHDVFTQPGSQNSHAYEPTEENQVQNDDDDEEESVVAVPWKRRGKVLSRQQNEVDSHEIPDVQIISSEPKENVVCVVIQVRFLEAHAYRSGSFLTRR